MMISSKNKQPDFIERSSAALERAVGLGFVVFAGASILSGMFTKAAVDTGIAWAGLDLLNKSAKNNRLDRAKN
jgi:hypothetical protein